MGDHDTCTLAQEHLVSCRCEFWVWCDHKKGCDDAGDFGSKVYPYHGCQLMQLPKDVEPQHWDRGPMFSSFQMGYITGEHAQNVLALFALGVEAACLDGLCGFSLTQAMLRCCWKFCHLLP